MKKIEKASSQKGSVLVYILIAVALFAALGFAVSNMMRGSGNIGTEKDGIYASEVLSYARTLREAVQAMKISNACEDTQISFERSPFDGSDEAYVNPEAPSDFTCHVFHPDGGGVGYQEDFEGKVWNFTSAFNVKGVGTEEPDLVGAVLVNRAVCEMINTRAGVSNADVQALLRVEDGAEEINILPAFQGRYEGEAQINLAAYEGKMTGCYLSSRSTGEDFTVYQVLVAQ